MVKADATPKTWMEFVKEVRDKNPGMALKDVLRLASKLRGKSSSGKSQKQKQKKRGGMLLPMLGGADEDANSTEEEGQNGAGRKSKKSRKSNKSQKKSRKSKSKKSRKSKRRH